MSHSAPELPPIVAPMGTWSAGLAAACRRAGQFRRDLSDTPRMRGVRVHVPHTFKSGIAYRVIL
jgi:hypothetical protein